MRLAAAIGIDIPYLEWIEVTFCQLFHPTEVLISVLAERGQCTDTNAGNKRTVQNKFKRTVKA